MKNNGILFSLVFLFLVSCSSTTSTTTPTAVACKIAADCTSATQTCQGGTCKDQTASSCRTSAVCATGYTCGANNKCTCGTVDHCNSGDLCFAGSCALQCTASSGCGPTDTCQVTTTGQPNACQAQIATNCKTKDICTANQGCINTTCTKVRRVFITSKQLLPGTAYVTGDFAKATVKNPTFGSVTDANTICNEAAATQTALAGTKWKAYIADSKTSAYDNVAGVSGASIPANDTTDVYLMDRTTKVSGPVRSQAYVQVGDFASPCTVTGFCATGTNPDTHAAVIAFNEAGVTVAASGGVGTWNNGIFTGINTGDFSVSTNANTTTCIDWTSKISIDTAIYGLGSGVQTGASDRRWHSSASFACTSPQGLYCVEVDK